YGHGLRTKVPLLPRPAAIKKRRSRFWGRRSHDSYPAIAGRKHKMNARRWLGALVLVGGLVTLGVSAHGQEKDKGKDKDKEKPAPSAAPMDVKLELKAFEPKAKPFWQEMSTKTKQVMKVMAMEVTQNQDQTFVVLWTPQEKKDNDLVVKQKIVGVKMD